jgi:GDP-L-fucose synthase
LVERGAKVTVAGMEPESKAHKYLPESATYIQRNFLDIEQCKNEIRGKQIVINLAGTKRSVGVGYKGISKFLVDMLRLQTNIMDISHEERVERFLFVGSICEYPPLEIRHEQDVWNGKPQQNDWIPGVQKRIGESQAEAYFLDTGWDAVRIVRPSNVYGPYDNFNSETAQVIPAIISKLINQPESLEVIGDGSNIRDFIYSEDVAFWSLAALENAPANYPINLGSGEGVSIKEIVSKLV